MNKTIQSSLIGIFGATVALISLTLSHLIAFYPLTYLKFDPAEIIVILSLLLFGPYVAIGIAFIHFALLNVFTGFPIIGPGMKFLAVISTIVGIYLGLTLFKFKKSLYMILFALILALVIRNVVMTIANYALFITIFAGFLPFAEAMITKAIGLPGSLFLILVFTAIYNSIHVLIAVLSAYYIAKLPQIIKLTNKITIPWILAKIKRT
jgi:riboflavin transporter FmnP